MQPTNIDFEPNKSQILREIAIIFIYDRNI